MNDIYNHELMNVYIDMYFMLCLLCWDCCEQQKQDPENCKEAF